MSAQAAPVAGRTGAAYFGSRTSHAENLRFLVSFFRQDTGAMVGLAIVAVVLLLIPLAPLLSGYPPETAIEGAARLPPSPLHWFGTDQTGLDIFTRVLYAPRTDVVIGMVGTFASVALGVPFGLIAGYYAGFGSEVMLRVADLIQAFPVFILALILVAIRGAGVPNLILAIAFVNAPLYMRLMRGQALILRERPFVEAAKCAGNSDWVILLRHLLPNALGPTLAQASVNMGWAILLTAQISFIGAGVPVPTPEWGLMVASGVNDVIVGQWWSSFFPGLAIAITVLGFALLGDAIERLFDPKRRL